MQVHYDILCLCICSKYSIIKCFVDTINGKLLSVLLSRHKRVGGGEWQAKVCWDTKSPGTDAEVHKPRQAYLSGIQTLNEPLKSSTQMVSHIMKLESYRLHRWLVLTFLSSFKWVKRFFPVGLRTCVLQSPAEFTTTSPPPIYSVVFVANCIPGIQSRVLVLPAISAEALWDSHAPYVEQNSEGCPSSAHCGPSGAPRETWSLQATCLEAIPPSSHCQDARLVWRKERIENVRGENVTGKDPKTTWHDQSLNWETCSLLFEPQLLTVD